MIPLKLILLALVTIVKGQSTDLKSLECDFKNDLCNWSQPGKDYWKLGDFGKALFNEPIKKIGRGGYTYIDPLDSGKYELISPTLDVESGPFCFYFQYYMFGLSVGKLSLRLVYIDGKDLNEEDIWSRSGSQYDEWILGKYHFVPNKRYGNKLQLQFVAGSGGIALGSIKVKQGSCEYNYDCDFEDLSLCFWSVEPDYRSNYRWLVANGSYPDKDLVDFDVTTQLGDGLFLRTPPNGIVGASSDLNSIVLSSSEAKCLSFYIFKPNSLDSDVLEISFEDVESKSLKLIWSSTLIKSDKNWIPISVDLESKIAKKYFKLHLKGHRLTLKSSSIGIDELSVSPEVCPNTMGSCDFNDGWCDYHSAADPYGQLLVGFGRLPTSDTNKWDPMKGMDPYDLFVYTGTNMSSDKWIDYLLESPIITPETDLCLSFSYNLFSEQKVTFSINMTPIDSKPMEIWSLDKTMSLDKNWKSINLAKFVDANALPFKLSLNFGGTKLFAAIDDILIKPCGKSTHTINCENDDLIKDECVKIVPSVTNNWQFIQIAELRQNISSIFSDASDNVLAFDLMAPSRSESMSYFYLENFLVNIDQLHCLKFWYIIDGDLDLKIWKSELRGDFDELYMEEPEITINNHFSLRWNQASITIENIQTGSAIIFGASYKSNVQGTIAINGLEVHEGRCKTEYNYVCDFEDENGCHWNNFRGILKITGDGSVHEGKNEWSKVLARKKTPGRDSTLETTEGHYLTIKDWEKGEAIFTFPPVYLSDVVTEMCLKMSIFPLTNNNLEIITEQNGTISLVEVFSGPSSGNEWISFETLIKPDPNISRVLHVYLVGFGSIAIDDLSIKLGGCAAGNFRCQDDGRQIRDSQVCDYKKDCLRGEDEASCGDCDFDKDFCGYVGDGHNNWVFQNGAVTITSQSGFFGWTKADGLTSNPLKPTSPTCKLRFNYSKGGSSRLRVLILFQDNRDAEVWDDDMLQQLVNETVTINLGRIPIPYNIRFYAQVTADSFSTTTTSISKVQLIDCDFGDTVDKSVESYTCKSGKHIALDQVCDSSFDCVGGDDEFNCDGKRIYNFENKKGPSYWVNGAKTQDKWSVQSAYGQISSMPSLDHTRGLVGSNYMAISLKKVYFALSTENEVSLVGPQLTSTEKCSMIFYYYTAGVNLTVSVTNNAETSLIKTLASDNVFGFKRERVVLNEEIQSPFSFLFKAHYSYEQTEYFKRPFFAVIDDIIIDSSCFASSEVPIKSNCSSEEFYCANDNFCIPSKKTCDFHSDCSDEADELYCGPCYFNSSTLCGWTNEGEDLWVNQEKYDGKIDQDQIPKEDKPDHFIVPNKSRYQVQSILKSPRLGATSPVCGFTFKYFVDPTAELSFRLIDEKEMTTKSFEVLKPSKSKWLNREIEMRSLTSGHRIIFILDSLSSTGDKTIYAGLADFKLIDCNPAWQPSWLTSTQPSTHDKTEPPVTRAPTIQPTTQRTKPTTQSTTTRKRPTKPTSPYPIPVTPTSIPMPVTERSQNQSANKVHFGSAPLILLGVATVVLVTIFAANTVKNRVFGYKPRNLLYLFDKSRNSEPADDFTVSMKNLIENSPDEKIVH